MDGLRGVAALVVVVHHALLVSPTLAHEYQAAGNSGNPAVRILVDTPLHLLWGGGEAVMVFFILSGMALTLPLLSGRPAHWLAYYPRRMIRLYFPVWSAAAFAIALFILFPRSAIDGGSWWLNKHDIPLTAHAVSRDVTLVLGSTFINSPLWSLRWEVLFSLALPLYFYLAKRFGQGWFGGGVLAASVLVAVGLGGRLENPYLLYLPVFVLGVLLAVNRQSLENALAKQSARVSWSLMVVALIALTGSWIPGLRDTIAAVPVTATGGTLLVALVAWRDEYRVLGTSQVIAWLGTISFSLYLIHEPILMSIAFHFEEPNAAVVLAVGLPLSLFIAWGFHLLIEGPSNTFSRAVGKFVATRS